jgi:hypothetical protein
MTDATTCRHARGVPPARLTDMLEKTPRARNGTPVKGARGLQFPGQHALSSLSYLPERSRHVPKR